MLLHEAVSQEMMCYLGDRQEEEHLVRGEERHHNYPWLLQHLSVGQK